jgi:hypothetical protein
MHALAAASARSGSPGSGDEVSGQVGGRLRAGLACFFALLRRGQPLPDVDAVAVWVGEDESAQSAHGAWVLLI